MYYNVCPVCGASLDPGEKCDCLMEFSDSEDYSMKRSNVTQIKKIRITKRIFPKHKKDFSEIQK